MYEADGGVRAGETAHARVVARVSTVAVAPSEAGVEPRGKFGGRARRRERVRDHVTDVERFEDRARARRVEATEPGAVGRGDRTEAANDSEQVVEQGLASGGAETRPCMKKALALDEFLVDVDDTGVESYAVDLREGRVE